jgi:hypothetical protein
MAKKAKLAVRYRAIDPSPLQQGMSTSQKLIYTGLVLISITGGIVWFGGLRVEHDGSAYRIVRRHAATRPASHTPQREQVTPRSDGRLIG